MRFMPVGYGPRKGRQGFLDRPIGRESDVAASGLVRCIGWNVQNPSFERAVRQAAWLEGRDFDVVALSETKQSKGCNHIVDRLRSGGYSVISSAPDNGDYGAVLAIRARARGLQDVRPSYLPYRVSSAECSMLGKRILFISTYIPIWQDSRKERFLSSFKAMLDGLDGRFDGIVLLGDMNILEPGHVPYHAEYKRWEGFYSSLTRYGLVDAFKMLHPCATEHSWYSREGAGYRFDHVFVSSKIAQTVMECRYIHEVRETHLSDHSAAYLELAGQD